MPPPPPPPASSHLYPLPPIPLPRLDSSVFFSCFVRSLVTIFYFILCFLFYKLNIDNTPLFITRTQQMCLAHSWGLPPPRPTQPSPTPRVLPPPRFDNPCVFAFILWSFEFCFVLFTFVSLIKLLPQTEHLVYNTRTRQVWHIARPRLPPAQPNLFFWYSLPRDSIALL